MFDFAIYWLPTDNVLCMCVYVRVCVFADLFGR